MASNIDEAFGRIYCSCTELGHEGGETLLIKHDKGLASDGVLICRKCGTKWRFARVVENDKPICKD